MKACHQMFVLTNFQSISCKITKVMRETCFVERVFPEKQLNVLEMFWNLPLNIDWPC